MLRNLVQFLSITVLALVLASCGNQGTTVIGPAGSGVFEAPTTTAMSYPARVATADDGAVYVADAAADMVLAYELSTGKALFSLGSGVGEFLMPNAIAVADDGRIYVVDSGAKQLRIYNSDGSLDRVVGSEGTFGFPSAVAIAGDKVFLADSGKHLVWVLDRDGKAQRSFGGEITDEAESVEDFRGQFTRVQGMAVHGSNLYVLDSFHGYVQVFDLNGNWMGFTGKRGACSSCVDLPLDVQADASGALWVTDPERKRLVTFQPELRREP